jgi:[ribosomal protein S18]-alanine N-acetyltransferase
VKASVQAMEIRLARATDVERVAEIEASCYSTPWSAEAFRSLLRRPAVRFLVGEIKPHVAPGETLVVGYGIVMAAGGEAELVNLAVEPSVQARGFGAAILDRVIAEAKGSGLHTLFLEVRDSNHVAIDLYASRGFRQIATRRHYYQRPVEDARVLRLSLPA